MNTFFLNKKVDKLQLTSQLVVQLKKFEEALEDFHENDFFSKNNAYCDYWKTELFYSPLAYKWTCGNGKSMVENYRKTNHICCIKPLYQQIKDKSEIKGRMLGVDPISTSFLLILELVQSSALVAYITQNKFLKNDESFLQHLLNNDDTTNIILDRILTFYQEYLNIEANAKNNIKKNSESTKLKDFLISELPALPSVPINNIKDKKIFDDGGYDLTENRDTYWHWPWKLIIPPLSWMDKFSSLKYPKLMEWNFLRQIYVKNDVLLDKNNLNVEFLLQYFFPFLDIDSSYVEAIVDQRSIKNNEAKITILFKTL